MAEHGHAQHCVDTGVGDRKRAGVGGDRELCRMTLRGHRQCFVLEVGGHQRAEIREPRPGCAGARADVEERPARRHDRLQQLAQ